MSESIPCKDCLLIPACRHKFYQQTLRTCDLIKDTLYDNATNAHGLVSLTDRKESFENDIREMETILKPTRWKVRKTNVGSHSMILGELRGVGPSNDNKVFLTTHGD